MVFWDQKPQILGTWTLWASEWQGVCTYTVSMFQNQNVSRCGKAVNSLAYANEGCDWVTVSFGALRTHVKTLVQRLRLLYVYTHSDMFMYVHIYMKHICAHIPIVLFIHAYILSYMHMFNYVFAYVCICVCMSVHICCTRIYIYIHLYTAAPSIYLYHVSYSNTTRWNLHRPGLESQHAEVPTFQNLWSYPRKLWICSAV